MLNQHRSLAKSFALLLAFTGFHFTAVAQTPVNQTTFKLNPKIFSSAMDPEIKAQITSDLALVASVNLSKSSPLQQTLFGTSTRSNGYLPWFLKRIKSMAIGNCNNDEAAVACVAPIFEANHLRLTKRYLTMNAPQVARMSVIFHEAKHTEYNPREKEGDPDLRFWMHAKCPAVFLDEKNEPRVSIWTNIPLAGLGGCDNTAVGSYGTVVVMLKNIAENSTNMGEKVRADALLYSRDQAARIIDREAQATLTNDQ